MTTMGSGPVIPTRTSPGQPSQAAGMHRSAIRDTTGRAVRILRATQHGLFAVLVLIGFVKSIRGDSPTSGALVGVALAIWYLVGIGLEHRWRTTAVGAIWLGLLSVLCVGAVVTSPDYAWVCFAVFVLFAAVLPARWAYAGIGILALVVGAVLLLRWPREGHWSAQFVGPLMGAGAAAALVTVYRAAANESSERQLLIDELLNAQDDLVRAHLDAGVRAERERMASEIHDTLAQGFASTVLLGRDALRSLEAGDRAEVERALHEVVEVASNGIEDARRLVRNLPPHELQDSALVDAIELLVESSGDRVTLRTDGDPRSLDPMVEKVLLRVAQEAIANAVQHSQAQYVVVTVTYRGDEVMLDVVDDGIGFSVADPPRSDGGFGLEVMARRTRGIGGSFTVESSRGEGTAVSVAVEVAGVEVAGVGVAGVGVAGVGQHSGHLHVTEPGEWP